MRRLVITLVGCGFPLALMAQVVPPRLDPTVRTRPDSTVTRPVMTAADSIALHDRMTASRKLFSECDPHAFQTCGSGSTSARLSLDGTAYGVLINVFDDQRGVERPVFLWRITGRVGIGGFDRDGGELEGGGGGGGRRGRKRGG